MLKERRLPPARRVGEFPGVKPEATVEDAVSILDQDHAPAPDTPWVEHVEIDSSAETDLLLWEN